MDRYDIARYADELGSLKAQKDAIADREAEIRLELIKAGITTGEGEEYKFQFVDQVRRITDWERIAEKFHPSRQLRVAHTTQRHIQALRVASR